MVFANQTLDQTLEIRVQEVNKGDISILSFQIGNIEPLQLSNIIQIGSAV